MTPPPSQQPLTANTTAAASTTAAAARTIGTASSSDMQELFYDVVDSSGDPIPIIEDDNAQQEWAVPTENATTSAECSITSYQNASRQASSSVPFSVSLKWLGAKSHAITKVAFPNCSWSPSFCWLQSLLALFWRVCSSFRSRLFTFFFGPIDEHCARVAAIVQQLRQAAETSSTCAVTSAAAEASSTCAVTSAAAEASSSGAGLLPPSEPQRSEGGGPLTDHRRSEAAAAVRRRRGRGGGEGNSEGKLHQEGGCSDAFDGGQQHAEDESFGSTGGGAESCCEAVRFSPMVSSFVERYYQTSSTAGNDVTSSTVPLRSHVRFEEERTERIQQLNEVVKFLHEEGEDAVLVLTGGEEGLDQLNNLVETNPTKALWFIRAFMLFGAVMGLLLSLPVLLFLHSRWASCLADSPLLTTWAVTNCILQAMQVPLRLAFFARLAALRVEDRPGIIFAIRGITKSSAWWLSRALSILSYLWVIFGMMWVCSLLFLYITSPYFHHIDTAAVGLSSSGGHQQQQPLGQHHHQPTTASYSSSANVLMGGVKEPSSSSSSTSSPTAALRLQDVAMSVLLLSLFRFVITLASFVHFFPQTVTGELRQTVTAEVDTAEDEMLNRRERLRRGALAMCQLPRLTVGRPHVWRKQRDALRLQSEGCSICLSDFSTGDELRLLRCRHSFHQTCIDRWLLLNCCCPLCWTTASVPQTSNLGDSAGKTMYS
eukprot:GHVS01094944.1.p1 GENE.GHVS01094944.1~~GHVS01094944.1.p1  ORF type:complete len:712 (-),score=170.90 GHVS01094944.1:495-2630(-)